MRVGSGHEQLRDERGAAPYEVTARQAHAGGAGKPPYRVLPGLLRAAAVGVAFVAWLLQLARAHLPLGRAGAWIDRAFAPLCHRWAERTLWMDGIAMPVCSRCAGILAGVAIGALFPAPVSARAWGVALALGATSMLADAMLTGSGARDPSHAVRAATGAAFGFALARFAFARMRDAARPASPEPGAERDARA